VRMCWSLYVVWLPVLEGVCYLHLSLGIDGSSMYLGNVGNHLLDYMTL
jgi:hypothetical protein